MIQRGKPFEDIVRCAFRHFDHEGKGQVSPETLTEVPEGFFDGGEVNVNV